MKFNNAQEVFDHVIEHLVTQGKRCYHLNGDVEEGVQHEICLYRSPEGMSCAVGCLISDEEYHPDMENAEVHSIIERFEQIRWMDDYSDLLCDLQDLHDEERTWNDEGLSPIGLKDIRLIAENHNLKNPLLTLLYSEKT